MLLSFQLLKANQPIMALDSLALVQQQDSIARVEHIQDSLNFQYVAVDSLAPNYFLDSLRNVVTVSDNDFVGWIKRMNVLKSNDNQGVGARYVSPEKFHRPVWVLVTVLLLFVSIGLVRLFFYNNFSNIIFGFYNDRILAQINKEDSIGTSWPYIFLYSIFTFSLGLFITVYQAYVLGRGQVSVVIFLKISIIIALLFLSKIVIVRLVGFLFDIEKLVREYVMFLYLFYFNSSLILMPLLLFVTFLSTSYFNFILIFFLLITLILFIYRFFRTILGLVGSFRFSIFYLILYLCTLEIAPILILVKSLNK